MALNAEPRQSIGMLLLYMGGTQPKKCSLAAETSFNVTSEPASLAGSRTASQAPSRKNRHNTNAWSFASVIPSTERHALAHASLSSPAHIGSCLLSGLWPIPLSAKLAKLAAH